MTALAWVAPFLALAGCAAYALSGRRAACLRRAIGIRALIGWTLACIAAVYAWRTVRHPARYARYLAARVTRRIPRRDPDGEPLDRDEMRAFIGLVESWRQSTAKPANGPGRDRTPDSRPGCTPATPIAPAAGAGPGAGGGCAIGIERIPCRDQRRRGQGGAARRSGGVSRPRTSAATAAGSTGAGPRGGRCPAPG